MIPRDFLEFPGVSWSCPGISCHVICHLSLILFFFDGLPYGHMDTAILRDYHYIIGEWSHHKNNKLSWECHTRRYKLSYIDNQTGAK